MKNLLNLLAFTVLATSPFANANITLVIDSWRSDDAVWNEKIIPAFNKHYPDIHIEYRSPTGTTQWEQEMESRYKNKTAGDLIACRPFDGSLALFNRGIYKEITDLDGMENFPSFAQAPWQTDSGAQNYCLPMASVIHGFFYNKDIFEKVGIAEPIITNADFYAALEKVKRGGYLPLAIGTKDKWEAATMGFQNIGPTYWKGEDGRDALLNGAERLDSAPYKETFLQLAKWGEFMGENFDQRSYGDAVDLFASGNAAVYPAGSWDIMNFKGKVNMGVFPPPVQKEGDACFFSDHTDIGMGINANSKNQKAAELFLEWMTTSEFAESMTNELSGFFSLSNHFFNLRNPIAQEMMSWRDKCDSTIRNTAQMLSRGEPNLEIEMWNTSTSVMAGSMTPTQAINQLQSGLESWYQPQKDSVRLNTDTCSALSF
ncbi:ABC transporter substrate-binding protein [Enterovibrio norvegicus]|uniref:ABC transporter substrate-binding protein n=1 Tax=Enterovibrio norvegicus TaxID=188144 RepID=UPI003D0AEA01